MEKLCNLVDIECNNEVCVILKIKPDKKIKLLELGCFDGNEEYLRLTKGDDHTCTVIKKDGKSFSWDWGKNGFTLVSEKTKMLGHLIQDCITEDFDIYMGSNKELVNKTLNIKSLEDTKNARHIIKMMYFKNDDNICVHKDNEFYKFFKTIDDCKKHFEKLNYDITKTNELVASTGAIVEEYEIIKQLEKNKDDEISL